MNESHPKGPELFAPFRLGPLTPVRRPLAMIGGGRRCFIVRSEKEPRTAPR